MIKEKYKKIVNSNLYKYIYKLTLNKNYRIFYLVFCAAVLFLTTLIWSVSGAKLEQSNADQLVNPMLLENSNTWHNALIPEQHSFLIKWPLFYLIKLLHYSNASYISITVISVILTIILFVFILSKIEKRPLILGTIMLALSSVLLLVPAQPYAGGILPVNMAMLTTRNLEYIVFVFAVIRLVQAKKILSKDFYIGALLLTLLIASDKLFLSVSLAGAVIALCIYCLRRKWKIVELCSKWAVLGLVSSILALLLLWLINRLGITHISAGSPLGPYLVSEHTKSIYLGIFYGVLGIATNYGANPGYNSLTIKGLPHTIKDNLLSLSGPAYIVNFLVLLFILFVVYKFIYSTVSKKKDNYIHDVNYRLGVVILYSAISVLLLFIASQHYYVVDARYLTLTLFAGFIILSVWLKNITKIDNVIAVLIGIVLFTGIVFGVFGALKINSLQSQAVGGLDTRNQEIINALTHQHVNYLVGDYWRVIPIKYLTGSKQQVVPLSDCTTYRDILTSLSWQPNLKSNSFAYLLTINGSLTNFPGCSIKQVTAAYGLPNSTILIDGSLGKPNEILLIYPKGIKKPKHHSISASENNAIIYPTDISSLTKTTCHNPTIMNISAHEDDDLLFMNPDITHEIKLGYCLRSVYITAGDDGKGQNYWGDRELGSEAAYSYMFGIKNHWINRTIRLSGGQYVSIASPYKNTNVSLIFMHLPDGNLRGDGFSGNSNQSLEKLYTGSLHSIKTVDKQSSYTAVQLVNSLTELMQTYLPTKIQTQADLISSIFPDHSDHITTGKFATDSRNQFEATQYDNQVTIPIVYYIGYPIHSLNENVTGLDLATKENTFITYGQYDYGVCHSINECSSTVNTYKYYLPREYTKTQE